MSSDSIAQDKTQVDSVAVRIFLEATTSGQSLALLQQREEERKQG